MHHYPSGPRGEAPAHSERRSDSSNSQLVGCARRAERHAGSDGHLISGICETLRSGDAARGTHHLIDRVDAWAYRVPVSNSPQAAGNDASRPGKGADQAWRGTVIVDLPAGGR